MHDSLFYLPGAVLSHSELISARLDGLLCEVGAGYMPADIPETDTARVTALAPVLLPGFAASGPTAAWVHGVGDAPPLRHHIQRAVDRRPRISARRDVVVHESRLPPDDVIMIASVPVTSLLRTMTDLVLYADRYRESHTWMRTLATEMPELLAPVREHLAGRPRLPGRRAALGHIERLSEATDYEDVTR